MAQILMAKNIGIDWFFIKNIFYIINSFNLYLPM